ncbi:MAG TPA: TlpA disulfide reductase family protein, partial [Candidatus Methylacidiphilales bacterium]
MKSLVVAALAAFLLLPVPARAADDNVQSELKSLVDTINAKLKGGEVTEQELAPELKEFDAILARHSEEKDDAAAQVLFMKAMLYVQVLNDPEKSEKIFNELQAKFPGTRAAAAAEEATGDLKRQEAAARIDAALKVGAPFPDFKEQDVNGAPMSVSGLKGKVVLVDFWATWCPPCVMELPSVRAAYEKYHDRGFDILGVSLDQDKATLVRFLKKNKVPWPQYFDGQGFDNKLAQKYGILVIPATFLLDRKGNILAKDLAGEELDEAVANALGP